MELYIPPPSHFLPRLPPPRPVVPAVPIVPIPDLPEEVHAPEGAYTLNASHFPSIGSPAAPLPTSMDMRMPTAASFLGAAPGFMVMPTGPNQFIQATGHTAMSFGSTVVNGQTQPAWPVKFSWATVWFPPQSQQKGGFGGLLGGGGTGGGREAPQTPGQPNLTGYEPSVSSDSDSPPASENPIPIAFPIETVPLSAMPQPPQTGNKRMRGFLKTSSANTTTSAAQSLPRPKNNLRSSNSTFVTRLQALDTLPKIMAEKGKGSGELVRWGFWNLGRTFGWGEEGGKTKDPYARVTFSQVPICHAVNQMTAGPDRLDIVVGFASGDLVWVDFTVGKYTRINKGGLLNNNNVLSVNFDRRQPHYFIAAFADSTIIQFNLFAEDPTLAAIAQTPMPWRIHFESQGYESAKESKDASTIRPPPPPAPNTRAEEGYAPDEERMVKWKNDDWATLPTNEKERKRMATAGELSPWAGKNPIAAWKVSKAAVTALAYSPDGRWLAVCGDDGCLRLIDVTDERLSDVFAGYFGSLSCVSWSPDSRFVATGGQDDLITIYSPRESRVVARCQGHTAFVTALAFDPARGGGYRFGSVGEDGKLVLWDFTAASLHRPRHHHLNISHHRLAGSTLSLPTHSHSHTPLPTDEQQQRHLARFHPAPPRSDVALLQPVMARMVEGNIVTAVHFTPSCIVTVSRSAGVKYWMRPKRQKEAGAKGGKVSGNAATGGLRSPRMESGGGVVSAAA